MAENEFEAAEVDLNIADRVQEKFSSLLREKPYLKANEATVLSGIIITTIDDPHGFIACIASGTKCVGQSLLTRQNGGMLHDSHAEVLVRRSLLLYLYNEINRLLDKKKSNLLDCYSKGSIAQYKIKEGVRFHLYISQPPCGDAAIFKTQSYSDNKNEVFINKTGAKPISNSTLRTKSGRSDLPDRLKTRSMSCSDKILLWNHIGLQGALLSHLLPEKIIYSSITVGSCNIHDTKHEILAALKRAVISRLDNAAMPHISLYHTQSMFKHNKSMIETKDSHHNCRLSGLSLNWINEYTDSKKSKEIEITVGTHGRRQGYAFHVKKGKKKRKYNEISSVKALPPDILERKHQRDLARMEKSKKKSRSRLSKVLLLQMFKNTWNRHLTATQLSECPKVRKNDDMENTCICFNCYFSNQHMSTSGIYRSDISNIHLNYVMVKSLSPYYQQKHKLFNDPKSVFYRWVISNDRDANGDSIEEFCE